MAVETLISVDEYLNTSYDPDVEYVDGVLVERNVGDYLHSLVQSNLVFALRRKYPQLKTLSEMRSKVKETRYRLPDVAVLFGRPPGKVLTKAAFVAIEILSEEDRMTRVIEKLNEYEAIGTPNIWVIDPRLEQIFVFRGHNLQEVEGDLIGIGDPRIELTREEIFEGVDEPPTDE